MLLAPESMIMPVMLPTIIVGSAASSYHCLATWKSRNCSGRRYCKEKQTGGRAGSVAGHPTQQKLGDHHCGAREVRAKVRKQK